eukprot:13508453-Heterocapsa_arctica.AAC.1
MHGHASWAPRPTGLAVHCPGKEIRLCQHLKGSARLPVADMVSLCGPALVGAAAAAHATIRPLHGGILQDWRLQIGRA